MGNDPDREPPFFFTKPADALVEDGATVAYPPATADLHYEAELVVALGKGGADIPVAEALGHIWGCAAGNDLTRRDLQAQAKAMKRPWDMAKAFDASAVCGALTPYDGRAFTGRIRCLVNGAERQSADLADMIWPVADVIAHLSGLVTLRPGDLIYTGTPAGVGALVRGDTCVVEVEGIGSVSTTIA
jgi:fumarylpyruvate hydrolase